MNRAAILIVNIAIGCTCTVAMIIHQSFAIAETEPLQMRNTFVNRHPAQETDIDTAGFEITSIPKYFKANISLFMTRQNGQTCIPYIMSYVSREQCGGTFTPQDYIKKYEADHRNIDVQEEGIVGTRLEINQFIQANFVTETYADAGGFRNAIDSGNTIMTTTLIAGYDGSKELHNILIIGYDSKDTINPKLYYMDPLYGRIFNDMTVNSFNVSDPAYVFVIRGCKK